MEMIFPFNVGGTKKNLYCKLLAIMFKLKNTLLYFSLVKVTNQFFRKYFPFIPLLPNLTIPKLHISKPVYWILVG